jgi:NTE family protein
VSGPATDADAVVDTSTARPRTAFVLGGGGVLGASEVGMARALVEADVRPDVVLGTSIGAINGAALARDPGPETVALLTRWWSSDATTAFTSAPLDRLRSMTRTALHTGAGLRGLLDETFGDAEIGDLAVPFGCCAASIERYSEHWFESGPLVPALMASCAVPGLFPPFRVGDEHFVDGGLVNSIPVSRAVELGARTVWVLQVGRIERPLQVPTRPWEVATVAFEIARRHRFARDLATIGDDVTVHVLPTGDEATPLTNVRYRSTAAVPRRIEAAYRATSRYLETLDNATAVAGEGI